YRKAQPIDSPRARYPGFKPSTTLLKSGTIRRDGARKLTCDIIFERDVAVKLRDGITIYTDVFRPANTTVKSPAIIAWGPYGKEIGGQWLDDVPGRAGVPLSMVSELQKFEAPDPAYWVAHGYIVLNPDARGAYMSEGNQTYYGRQMAEDGYDFVEWAAAQSWSNGKTAFSGNSYLAISQWFIAAEKPPHLTAIAPWEGFYDGYREAGRRGGIAQPGFGEEIVQTYAGNAYIEDHVRMQLKDDLMNPYWEDKIARIERIDVPAYVVASYTSPIHTHGSFEGFRRIATKDKWLRVHNTGEWDDYYNPAHVEDLRKFFDRYLKDIKNEWEKTPRVRYSVLDPGAKDTIDIETTEWPVPGTTFTKFYPQADKTLRSAASPKEESLSYEATQKGGEVLISFNITETTELIGYSKVKLWVEAAGSDDIELTVAVTKRKLDGTLTSGAGKVQNIAAAGLLRVSQRALDTKRSTESEPFQLHTKEELLKPGEIVPVEIALWPIGLRFRPGETMVLSIA
ncbi:alpha/beta-hydrolase, partial [Microthyrium microscopicum]